MVYRKNIYIGKWELHMLMYRLEHSGVKVLQKYTDDLLWRLGILTIF